MARRSGSEPQTVEVNLVTSKGAQRKQMSDALAEWKRTEAPTLSIDVLLTRPIDSVEMALAIVPEVGMFSESSAGEMLRDLQKLRAKYPELIDAINLVCARAMNDRKCGLLKPTNKNGRHLK